MKTKIWIAVVVLLIVIASGLAVFWPFRNNHVLRLPGVVEVQEVRLGSKVGGRILKVLVEEGNEIYPGKELVVFEAPELRNQRQQMKAKLDGSVAEWERAVNGPRQEEKDIARAAMKAAEERWKRAKFGWRVEEKRQAKSELDTAEADYEQAVKEWTRVAPLFLRDKSVSATEYEAALAARDRARGRKDSAKARVDMMKAGTRPEDKAEAEQEYLKAKAQFELLRETRKEDRDIAKAKVDELKASLEAIDINLAETTIVAPPNLGKAFVEVIAFRQGDIVQPNQPVLRVLRVEDLWVKIYVPETQYGLVTNKKKVHVTIDSHPGERFEGEVVQRENVAQFTPRNVQSVDERRHQVFGVKVRVDDPRRIFNAGMAAEVTIPLD